MSITAPSYVPDSNVEGGTPPSGFDTSATFIGALDATGADWTADWTAFPEN